VKPQPITKQILIIAAMVFALYVLLIPKNFVGLDGENWKNWSLYIFENGLGKAYNNTDISYPPIYIYGLYIFTLLYDSAENLLSHLYFTRVIALAFDFITIAILLKYIPAIKKQPIVILFLLLNIAFVYNSLIWWQTDSIHTAFILLAIIMALYHKPALTIMFFVLAINAKLNAIIYAPVILLLLIPVFSTNPFSILSSIIIGIATQVILWYPFIQEGNISIWLNGFLQRVDYYHFASMKAYNFWYLFLNDNPRNILDNTIAFNSFSYKNIGAILFVVTTLLALFPLAKKTFQNLKQRVVFSEKDIAFVFLTLGLLTLVFFFFPTRIHERYAHAGVLFFFIHACYSNSFRLYVLYSIAYFINLEKEAQFLLMPNEVDEILKPQYVGIIYAIIGISAFRKLYAKQQEV
jgi:Gpi18-like mannosyltransferase